MGSFVESIKIEINAFFVILSGTGRLSIRLWISLSGWLWTNRMAEFLLFPENRPKNFLRYEFFSERPESSHIFYTGIG